MAHGRPWYKRSGGDFVMAVIGMPDAEHKWAYSAIVDMLNDRDRPIEDDAGFVCGFTGLSKKKWGTVRTYLLDKGYLVQLPDGRLSNPRFERERAERQEEHDRAVATGKVGGRKSAALRAAGQGDLDLDEAQSDDNRAEESPINTPKNGSRVADKLPKNDTDESNSKHLAEGPRQPSRAREEARGERRERESTTANPSNRAGHAGDAFDLLGLMNRFAQLGGVAIINPTAIAREVDFVKAWLSAGYDVEETIVPAITQLFADTNQDSIGSLNFYSARIAKLHSKRLRDAPAGRKEETPILLVDGEEPLMGVIRRDLLKALGNWAYCGTLNHMTLRIPDMGEEDKRRPLEAVTDQLHRWQLLNDSERRRTVRRAIAPYGFTELWQATR
jgi:hypothetical protein